jgi:hypothetical protein
MGYLADTWKEFIQEGNRTFDYMIHNFERLFDGQTTIKQFNIRCGRYIFRDEDIEAIKEEHGADLQKELIHWIHKEKESNELFKRENWNSFRDYFCHETMYFGYKKMFRYKQFYFQLALEEDEHPDPVFQLAIWGWNNEEFIKRREGNEFVTFPNDIIPSQHWRDESTKCDDKREYIERPRIKIIEHQPPIHIGEELEPNFDAEVLE